MIPKKRKKRKGARGFLGIIIMMIIVVSVIVFLFSTNWRIEQRREEVSAKSRYLKQEVERLEAQKNSLESKVAEAGDITYLEKEARDKLQLKKKGEEVVTIIAPETTGESTQAAEKPKDFWQELIEGLGFEPARD